MTRPEVPFDQPWQAQAFGLAVALSDAGVFGWPQWTTAFGARLACGVEYWDAWVQTLEAMLADHAIAGADEVDRLALAWQEAAHATPHGQAIRLGGPAGGDAGRDGDLS